MLSFTFQILNPFAKDVDMVDYVFYDTQLTEHKAFEIQISKMSPYSLFSFGIDTSWRGRHHAGPEITIDVWGYYFSMRLYDIRHWNYDEGTWRKVGEN